MESKTNYTLVGIIVLALAAGLLITGLWLSVGFDQKKYNKYIVYMSEPVSGLNEESLIKYNGVKVGFVSAISLNKRDPQQVKIILRIEDGTPITQSTQATLITQGITGSTYLGLVATSSTNIPLKKQPDEEYPVIPYKPSFFNQLEKNINDLSVSVKRVFTEENAQNIEKILANLRSTTDVITQNNEDLNKSLHSLPLLINDLAIGIQRFNSMALDVANAGKQVSSTMRAGRNSIDKISQQAIPPAVVLLRRLDLITANLEKVTNQMRQNPSVIIRGSAPAKRGPGE